MSNVLNFKGVEEAGRPLTSPGTKDVFTLKSVVFGASKEKGTASMTVEFIQRNELSGFKESFYITEKAMGRIQHLVSRTTGTKLDGDVTEEQMIAKLQGKKIGLKVIGRVGQDGNGYPCLPYGGFACKPEEVNNLEFTPQEQNAINAALKAAEEARSKGADSEGSSSSSSPGSASSPSTGSVPGEEF